MVRCFCVVRCDAKGVYEGIMPTVSAVNAAENASAEKAFDAYNPEYSVQQLQKTRGLLLTVL